MDPLANFLTQLRNAALASKSEVVVPHSKLKEACAKILKEEGFLEEAKTFKEKGGSRKFISARLSFDGKKPRLAHIRRISKPGQRIYSSSQKLSAPPLGIRVVSTPQGLMKDKEARKKKLGGEVLFEVW